MKTCYTLIIDLSTCKYTNIMGHICKIRKEKKNV